jgi:hypothetical protein
MRTLLRQLAVPLEWLLALVILFEEWGWEPMQRFMERLALWPGVMWLERRIASLPPAFALAAFALPSLMLLPVNLAGVWLVGEGRALSGSVVIVAAKLVSTSLVGRIFMLTRPVLLQLGWFARAYARWQIWEAALLAPVRASWVWQTGRALKQRWRQWRSGRSA